jgi:hypothetical protein
MKGVGMRRFVVALVALALLASLAGHAQARSLRVRHDRNDSELRTDIRRVVTDLTGSAVFIRIDAWQRFSQSTVEGGYFVYLDTAGDRGFDRLVHFFPSRRGLKCWVGEVTPLGETGNFVGARRVTRPTERSVACRLPRSWFLRIQRAVRSIVLAVNDRGFRKDRAPDHGSVYRWL